MKLKYVILFALVLAVLISGCISPEDSKVVDENEKKYVSMDPEECKRIQVLCVEGKESFFDDTGCGCKDKELV